MSFPANPLDKYRSVSYQTILLASSSTEGIRPFVSSNPETDAIAMTAITETAQGDVVNVAGASAGAYLVFDSRRHSNFSIREFSFSSIPGTGVPSQTHISTGQVEMTVIDPDGIVFINYLKYLMDEKLKTEITGVTFLLKVIFVGHTYDHKVEVVTSSSIPMIMINMEFDVTYKEGIYNLQFAPLTVGAAANLKQFAALKDVTSVRCDDQKLGSMISDLENRLNESHRDWYKKLNVHLKKAGEAGTDGAVKTGRLVQVMITIPESWQNYKIEDGTFESTTERNHAAERKKKEEAINDKTAEYNAVDANSFEKGSEQKTEKTRLLKQYLSIRPNATIFDALADIFKICPEVSKMANRKAIEKDEITIFKTISSVTSNDEVIVLHFDVVEFKVPNITIPTEKAKDEWYYTTADGKKVPKNSIEFDYIFSGKNTDILDMSLKMKNANLLLMNTSKTGTMSHRLVNNQKVQPDQPQTTEKIITAFVRENDPIVFPAQSPDQKNNYAYQPEKHNVEAQSANNISRNEWLQSVAFMHGQTQLRSKITIRGNPELLNKFVIDTLMPHVIPDNIKISEVSSSDGFRDTNILGSSSAWTSAKSEYRKNVDIFFSERSKLDAKVAASGVNDKIVGDKAYTYPLFFKINIFSPNNLNFGSSTAKIAANNSEYTQFWYDGWYFVNNIINKFSDGMFIQEIDIGAFDLYGPETASTTAPRGNLNE